VIRRALLAAVLAGLAAACAGAAKTEGPATTNESSPATAAAIDGEVRITGDCPVEPIDRSCPDEPYVATIKIERLDRTFQVEVTSRADGRFHVDVPPGRYRLVPEQPQPGAPPVADEQLVDTVGNGTTQVIIRYERGVR